MATILSKTKSTYGSPYCYYKVDTTSITNRTTNSVSITFQITSNLASSSSSLGRGYTLTGGIYIDGAWNTFTIKSSNDAWSGTTTHTATKTIVVNNLTSTQTSITNVKFRSISSASDNASQLNATNCSNITIPTGHEEPVVSLTSITETNATLVSAGIQNNVLVNGASEKDLVFSYTTSDSATITNVKVLDSDNRVLTETATIGVDTISLSLDNKEYTDIGTNQATLRYIFTDSLNASTTITETYTLNAYTSIKAIETSTNAKRSGVLGDADLNINGTYYNGTIGSIDQSGSYKPTIKYKFWLSSATEPSSYPYTINASDITISNGTYSVSNKSIGSINPSDVNYFNPNNVYRVRLQIQDNLTTYISSTLSIPIAIPVWKEYKDRVDFKKLTIQGVEITPGGGGTGDYSQLINKPSINTITLSGDKSSSDLGLQSQITSSNKLDYSLLSNTPTIPTNTSQLTNDSGFIDNTYHDSSKQDTLVSGTNIKTINNQSLLGSGDITIQSSAPIDNSTITLNASNQLQTVGIIDQQSSNVDKFWTGTQAQYNAIATKDSNTFYAITDDETNYVVDANYVHTDNNFTTSYKNKVDSSSVVSINKKTTSGTNIFDITINGTTTQIYAPTSGGGGVTDYDQLSSRPRVNGITLVGSSNNTLDNLGIQSKITSSNKLDYSLLSNTPTIPTKTSDLTNDSNFVASNTANTFTQAQTINADVSSGLRLDGGLNNYANMGYSGIEYPSGPSTHSTLLYTNIQTKGTILYESTAGTNSSITLSDSSANYDYLEIYYSWGGGSAYGFKSTKIYDANGKLIPMDLTTINNNYFYTTIGIWRMNGTTFSQTSGERWRFGTSGSPTRAQNATDIYVHKVVGYKE